jgi:hypothetical protein
MEKLKLSLNKNCGILLRFEVHDCESLSRRYNWIIRWQ